MNQSFRSVAKRSLAYAISLWILVPGVSISSEPANSIRAVWNLSAQPCNGGIGNAMNRHPHEKAIQQSKEIKLESLGLVLKIPQISDINDTHVKLFFGDKSRGVVDNYILFSRQDLAPPSAAIVITELPKELQQRQKALNAAMKLQAGIARRSNIYVKKAKLDGPYGNMIDLFIENRIGTHCYPTADYEIQTSNAGGETIGISRFFVIKGKLIEFALIVEGIEGKSEMEKLIYAQKLMNEFYDSLREI